MVDAEIARIDARLAAEEDARPERSVPGLAGAVAPRGVARAQPLGNLLGPGSGGAAVRELQALLSVAVDGRFGQATEAAVRKLQETNGLEVTGKTGPETWDVLVQPWVRLDYSYDTVVEFYGETVFLRRGLETRRAKLSGDELRAIRAAIRGADVTPGRPSGRSEWVGPFSLPAGERGRVTREAKGNSADFSGLDEVIGLLRDAASKVSSPR
jgi:hypothetical protein